MSHHKVGSAEDSPLSPYEQDLSLLGLQDFELPQLLDYDDERERSNEKVSLSMTNNDKFGCLLIGCHCLLTDKYDGWNEQKCKYLLEPMMSDIYGLMFFGVGDDNIRDNDKRNNADDSLLNRIINRLKQFIGSYDNTYNNSNDKNDNSSDTSMSSKRLNAITQGLKKCDKMLELLLANSFNGI